MNLALLACLVSWFVWRWGECLLLPVEYQRVQLAQKHLRELALVGIALSRQGINDIKKVQRDWESERGQLDPWGQPYIGENTELGVFWRSSGPDRRSGNRDDLVLSQADLLAELAADLPQPERKESVPAQRGE